MKISRHTVAKRYASQIEAMYPESLQLEAREVSQVQIEPERLRGLLEKGKILDAWMADAGIEFLFELARDKQIDGPSMVNICDTVAMIAQMENEEVPLSTALIVGNPVRIGRVLPQSQIQLLHHDHIRRMRKTLVTLAKIVDGLVLGYVLDEYGYRFELGRAKLLRNAALAAKESTQPPFGLDQHQDYQRNRKHDLDNKQARTKIHHSASLLSSL